METKRIVAKNKIVNIAESEFFWRIDRKEANN